jgi:hypothetical protein
MTSDSSYFNEVNLLHIPPFNHQPQGQWFPGIPNFWPDGYQFTIFHHPFLFENLLEHLTEPRKAL